VNTIIRPLSIHNSTGTDPEGWRRWWAAESIRIGTNWIGIAETITAILLRVTMCPTCGNAPCRNPGFCAFCRDADARKAHGKSPDSIPPNWDQMSVEALVAHFDRHRRMQGAPPTTVEALVRSLRQRGVKALTEPAVQRRLSELNENQLHAVCNRLQRLQPQSASAWAPEQIIILVDAWNGCHG
jgi:hypothetical protein